jgi:hypothetical protein
MQSKQHVRETVTKWSDSDFVSWMVSACGTLFPHLSEDFFWRTHSGTQYEYEPSTSTSLYEYEPVRV